MTQAEIEKTLDQLVRRARYFDAMQAWLVEHWPRPEVDEESARLRAVHGVVPFEEPPPAPQPASEGVRWFRISDSNEDRFHEGTTWTVYPVGEPLATKGGRTWHVHLKINEAERQVREGNWVELDGPPPHGKPLAKPATEGDGKPEDAPADRTRLTLYPSQMCEATRAAFNWISRHDGGAHGALFTRAVSDACAEYAAHMTAALTKERDSLRAEAEKQKQRADALWADCAGLTKERDDLRAKLAKFTRPSRRPARKGRGVKRGK